MGYIGYNYTGYIGYNCLSVYRYVRPQRVWFLSRFGHKRGINFSRFLTILVINRKWVMYPSLNKCMFFKKTLPGFSSLSKRKSTKALHRLCLRQFNIGLNLSTDYNASLKQDFDVMGRS